MVLGLAISLNILCFCNVFKSIFFSNLCLAVFLPFPHLVCFMSHDEGRWRSVQILLVLTMPEKHENSRL